MDEDITFSVTCVLSSVVSTSTEETEAVVEVRQPCRVYEGVRIKCGLHYCVAWKMSLHRGGGLSSNRFKENPDNTDTSRENSQRVLIF